MKPTIAAREFILSAFSTKPKIGLGRLGWRLGLLTPDGGCAATTRTALVRDRGSLQEEGGSRGSATYQTGNRSQRKLKMHV